MSRSLCLLILVVAAGCSQRPVPTIRDRGDFLFRQGDYATAAKEYAEITDRYPGDWEAHYQLGRCRLELGELADARANLEIAYTIRPGDADVVDLLAETMYQQDDREALFVFVKERAESKQTVRAWLRLGRYAADLGDADSAQTAYDTAILLDGGISVEPYLEAATFAEHIGDTDQALRRLRQAYGINPRDARVNQRLRALDVVPGPTIALPTDP